MLGQRPVANNLMVDGFDNNDRILGGPSGNFSQESVREFQVLTSSYPAEFGNATGGVVNIVTRSGSNSVHGTAFLYHRNTALNARGYFEQFDPFGTPVDLPKATFRQNQFGGSIGAPLRRDRTFLFVAVEQAPTRASNVVTIEPDVASTLDCGRLSRCRPAWCRTSRAWASWSRKAITTGGPRTACRCASMSPT